MADKKAKDEGGTAVLESIKLGDLRRNREGIVSVDPLVEINQLCTVVEARQFLGYGGFLAIENQHGLQKALHRDGIYTLSNGQRYVVPFEIHEALGIPLPPAPEIPGEAPPPEAPVTAAAKKDDRLGDFK